MKRHRVLNGYTIDCQLGYKHVSVVHEEKKMPLDEERKVGKTRGNNEKSTAASLSGVTKPAIR